MQASRHFSSAVLANCMMLAFAMAMLPASMASAASPMQVAAEKELMRFDPSSESDVLPIRGEPVTELSLAGTWVRGEGGYDIAELVFTPDAAGGYHVAFRAAGCVGQWTLDRRARFSAGVVLLDSPVQEYAPSSYSRLHAVRLDGETYLLPSAEVARFNLGQDVEWLTYRRASSQ